VADDLTTPMAAIWLASKSSRHCSPRLQVTSY